ncbi:RHS repeat-associated core domain-containing protein [Chryseobacterium indologenes]|uniref:RHS repeat-associated core domain-containing protein n=1 Tax=Chryseobacterium indologenes TaxID=253 RepID=UPI003C6CD71C
MDTNNYYPFGMMHNYTATTQNAYQYKYNGKELQESGMYDYGARMYMPDLGRWGVIDPLAETSRRWSTYAYAYDNPVMFIDPDGMQNVSALHWKFDQNSTILGNSWFDDSYVSSGFGGNFKTMWNGGDHGGSGGSFLQSQMFKDAMAYLAEPGKEYFKETDFSHFADGLKIISREEWGARNPIKKGRSWEGLPVSLAAYYDTITIHHSGNRNNYMNIQQLQIQEQAAGYADIPYHFAIDSQGNIYEGRPIYIKGSHVEGANTSNIGIVLMADLDHQDKGLTFRKFLVEKYYFGSGEASPKMRQSLTNLVNYLNNQYGIQYLGGHIEKINNRYCPGDEGMKIVRGLREKFHMQILIKQ